MKLNEIRYFRQPRPYARRRITKMRLLPDSRDLHDNNNASSKNQQRRSSSFRSSERSRDRCVTLDRDQRSKEIAWFSYTSDSEKCPDNYFAKYQNRDTFVETDPEIEISIDQPERQNYKLQIVNDVKLLAEPKKSNKFSITREVEIGAREILEKEEKRTMKLSEDENDEKRSERLEEGLQVSEEEIKKNGETRKIDETKEVTNEKILDMKIIEEIKVTSEKNIIQGAGTKKINETRKLSENEIARVAQRREFEKRETKSSTRGKCHDGRENEISRKHRGERSSEDSKLDGEKSFWLRYESLRKIIDFFGHLLGRRGTTNRDKENPRSGAQNPRENGKTSSNGETKKIDLSTRYRRSSRKTSNATKVADKWTEDRFFYGLTRDTKREENLRATLLEHEMRNRKLEEENRRYKKMLEDKLKTRQMSSPLH